MNHVTVRVSIPALDGSPIVHQGAFTVPGEWSETDWEEMERYAVYQFRHKFKALMKLAHAHNPTTEQIAGTHGD